MRTTSVSRYHLNSFFTTKDTKEHQKVKNALCDWLVPVYAVTGIPVLVYFHTKFSWISSAILQATSTLLPCGDFHRWVSVRPSAYSTPSLLLYQVVIRLLLLNAKEIIRAQVEGVKNRGWYICAFAARGQSDAHHLPIGSQTPITHV